MTEVVEWASAFFSALSTLLLAALVNSIWSMRKDFTAFRLEVVRDYFTSAEVEKRLDDFREEVRADFKRLESSSDRLSAKVDRLSAQVGNRRQGD